MLLPQVAAADTAKDVPRFQRPPRQWMDDMALFGRLLAGELHFLLGSWLVHAHSVAENDAEAAQLEYDQRSNITRWGDHSGADRTCLHDDANRGLSGLVSGLYAPHWQRYFDALAQAMAHGTPTAPIDWFAMELGLGSCAQCAANRATERRGADRSPHRAAVWDVPRSKRSDSRLSVIDGKTSARPIQGCHGAAILTCGTHRSAAVRSVR